MLTACALTAVGVASLAPSSGSTTYGAVVELTDVELELLDSYEGGYSKQWVEVHVADEAGSGSGAMTAATCCVYLANNPVMKVPPTEQYLCAIHVMLREHWNMEGGTIEVRAAQPDGAPRIVSKWQHPGAQQLTLPALIVEANALRATPWEMPQTIGQVCAKLASVGEPFFMCTDA